MGAGRAPYLICLNSSSSENLDTDTHVEGEHHANIKAQVKVTQQKPSEITSKPPGVRREACNRSFTSTFRKNQPLTLGLWPPAL